MGRFSRGMAAQYFVEEIAPMHRRSGVPDEAIEWMGRRYVADVDANHAAQLEIVEHYDQALPSRERDVNLELLIQHGAPAAERARGGENQ